MDRLIALKGDIFKEQNNYDLTIVFGHLGFNLLKSYWEDYQKQNQEFDQIENPFLGDEKLFHLLNGTRVLFIKDDNTTGIDDSNLKKILDDHLQNLDPEIKSILTNGVNDDRNKRWENGIEQYNKERVKFLKSYFNDFLSKNNNIKKVGLIDLTDAFLKY